MKNVYVLLFLLTPGIAQAKEAEEIKITIVNATDHTLVGSVGPHSVQGEGRKLENAKDVLIEPRERHVVTFEDQPNVIHYNLIKLQIKGTKKKADAGVTSDRTFWVSVDPFDSDGIRIRNRPPSPAHSRTPSPTPRY